MRVNFAKCTSVLITGASRGLGLQMVNHLVGISESPQKIIATARSPDTAQELHQIAKSHPEVYIVALGASRGLGLQMVKHLVGISDRPQKIIATARSPDTAQELQQIAKSHPEVYIVPLDVVNDASIEAAVQKVSSIVGPAGLNCLINNAGIGVPSDLNSETRDRMMTTFQSNTASPLFVTRAFLPLLRAAAAACDGGVMSVNRAAVINVSSLLGSVQLNWGETSVHRAYAYRVSKAGLNMLTRCLALDLQSERILCTVVHPGWVQTDMGGKQAPLTPEESISSLLSVVCALSEKDTGQFLDYEGKNLPW